MATIVEFSPPLEWEDETHEGVDVELLGRLRGKDKLAIMAALRKRGVRDVMQPETDDRYLLAALERATGIPEEALVELPIRQYNAVILEAQGFLLGSAGGATTTSGS